MHNTLTSFKVEDSSNFSQQTASGGSSTSEDKIMKKVFTIYKNYSILVRFQLQIQSKYMSSLSNNLLLYKAINFQVPFQITSRPLQITDLERKLDCACPVFCQIHWSKKKRSVFRSYTMQTLGYLSHKQERARTPETKKISQWNDADLYSGRWCACCT